MTRKILVNATQARALFDALQLARSWLEGRIEAHNQAGDIRLEQLVHARWKGIDSALDTLGAELQDIAAPTYEVKS